MMIKKDWIGTDRCEVHYGDIVQINPEKDNMFGGCFMFVEEVGTWGVQGYVSIPSRTMEKSTKQVKNRVSMAYVRKEWEDIEWVGQSVWRKADETTN